MAYDDVTVVTYDQLKLMLNETWGYIPYSFPNTNKNDKIRYKKDVIRYKCASCEAFFSATPASIIDRKEKGQHPCNCYNLKDGPGFKTEAAVINRVEKEIEFFEEEANKIKASQEAELLASTESEAEITGTIIEKNKPVIDKDFLDSLTEKDKKNLESLVDYVEKELIGNEVYDSEEEPEEEKSFEERFNEGTANLVSILGYMPYEAETVSLYPDGTVHMRCDVCRNVPVFKNLDEVFEVKYIKGIPYHNCGLCEIDDTEGNLKMKKLINDYCGKHNIKLKTTFVLSPSQILTFEYENGELFESGIDALSQVIRNNAGDGDYSAYMDKIIHEGEAQNVVDHVEESIENVHEDSIQEVPESPEEVVVPEEVIIPEKKRTTYGVDEAVRIRVSRPGQDDSLASLDSEREKQNSEEIKGNVFEDVVIDKNPFVEDVTLIEEFYKKEVGKFLTELVEHMDEHGVTHALVIDPKTYEIPVVDFSSGYRVIFHDLNYVPSLNIPFGMFERLPFTYKQFRNDYKTMIVYSDSIKYRKYATIRNLRKVIDPAGLQYGDKRLTIGDKFDTYYTKNSQLLNDFEERYSPYPYIKPKSSEGRLGVIVKYKSEQETEASRSKKIMDLIANMQYGIKTIDSDNLTRDYDMFIVASVKWIYLENRETGKITYTITNYTEITTSYINDGLYLAILAIVKEHYNKYGTLANMIMYLERDPTTYTNLGSYVEHGSLIVLDQFKKMIFEGASRPISSVYLNKCYIRLPNHRNAEKQEDYMRQDIRLFSGNALSNMMARQIAESRVDIRDPAMRIEFIRSLGYVEINIPPIQEYFVSPHMITSMLTDFNFLKMMNLDFEALMNNYGAQS